MSKFFGPVNFWLNSLLSPHCKKKINKKKFHEGFLQIWSHLLKKFLTLFRMGIFGAAHRWWERSQKGPSLPKISHTYSTMMKLGTDIPYLKKIQKIYESRHTPWLLLISAFFHRKSANFVISRNTDIDYI